MRSERNEKLADFATLIAWLTASISMAVIAYTQFGQDFRGYYAAARVLLNGGNPYDYLQVAPILMDVTGRIGNNPFYLLSVMVRVICYAAGFNALSNFARGLDVVQSCGMDIWPTSLTTTCGLAPQRLADMVHQFAGDLHLWVDDMEV